MQGLPSLSTATDYPCADNPNAQNLDDLQLAKLHAIFQTAWLNMFVAFPLEKKNSEAAGSNTALGAFKFWINPAQGNSCELECYLSSTRI